MFCIYNFQNIICINPSAWWELAGRDLMKIFTFLGQISGVVILPPFLLLAGRLGFVEHSKLWGCVKKSISLTVADATEGEVGRVHLGSDFFLLFSLVNWAVKKYKNKWGQEGKGWVGVICCLSGGHCFNFLMSLLADCEWVVVVKVVEVLRVVRQLLWPFIRLEGRRQ